MLAYRQTSRPLTNGTTSAASTSATTTNAATSTQQPHQHRHSHPQHETAEISTASNDHLGGTTACHRHCQSPDYNLAMILAGIVIVFVLCHSFRFFLAFYHVSTVQKTILCVGKLRNVQMGKKKKMKDFNMYKTFEGRFRFIKDPIVNNNKVNINRNEWLKRNYL